jgi:hypothetical protein
MERSFTCSSPSFLCHIHHKNPNIINVIQHWQSSSLKKEYQVCSFVHSRHHKLKNWTCTSWFNTRIFKTKVKEKNTIMV